MPAEQDVIGPWSEVKLDILRAYAVPYSTILTARNFHRYYIDAFAAGGSHISRKSGVGRLRELGAGRADVHVHLGDCNEILLQHVFPKAGMRTIEEHYVCSIPTISTVFKQWGGVQKKRTGRMLDGRTYDDMPGDAEASSVVQLRRVT